MRCLRLILSSSIAAIYALAHGSGSVQISAYPLLSVADGRSTVTVTALVRNSGGTPVSDGTLVRFSTSAGSFREADVRTASGTARAVMVAPNEAGVVTVTVSAVGLNVVNTYDIEFVRDRSMLISARQYAEITGPDYLVYHTELRIVSATGKDRSAKVSFRDIRIAADDMQINLMTMTVVASNATLNVGNKSIDCRRLRYMLSQRRGTAIAMVDGKLGYAKIVAGDSSVDPAGMKPTEFDFDDVGRGQSSVHSERIVAFPNRELQFHHARLFVGDTKVMQFPLYALKPNSENSMFSEQLVSFQNGGVVLNYPHYISLSPSFTSVVRLKSGQNHSRGSSTSQGLFLEWENKYMLGDKADGGLGLSNIGRDDMGLTWRHTQRLDYDTTATAYLDMPSFRSLYGNMGITRVFEGFTVQATATSSKSLRGFDSESQRVDISADTETKRLAGTPFSYSFGATANSSRAIYGSTRTEQEGVGLRSRFLFAPQPLWSGANLTGSATFTHLWGDGRSSGMKILGTLGVTTPLTANSVLRVSYDYAQDGFTSELLGRHRLGGEFTLDSGNFSLALIGSKALDIDSYQFLTDASWSISNLWRIGSSLSWDKYLGELVTDHLVWFGYRLGTREFALTYSPSNERFGFQLGNVTRR